MPITPVEYVFVDSNGIPRSKTRSLERDVPAGEPLTVDEVPEWNYDGSSTKQAEGHDSEILLRPGAVYRDPFRSDIGGWMAICESVRPDGTAAIGNHRAYAKEIFDRFGDEHRPWFGLEQEYTLFKCDGRTPLAWPDGGGVPEAQGKYYCGAGTGCAIGREVAEEHYRACLRANLNINGLNSEVCPSQWEYQLRGESIDAADQMIAARYILLRVAEKLDVVVNFDPKPMPGDWNGAGCHTNYSTRAMREDDDGYEIIKKAIAKLGAKHAEHIAVYGSGNERRLTGRHETASIDTFSWGVADRGASVRVPRETARDGKGYLEDRRPASNCDPYLVTAKITETTLG